MDVAENSANDYVHSICACVRACVHAYVRACMCVCVCGGGGGVHHK